MGHSFSLSKRLQDYLARSAYGKNIQNLWSRSSQGKHYTCDEWKTFKNNFKMTTNQVPAYEYKDEKFLNTFLSRKLKPLPQGADFETLVNRLSKATVRGEINDRMLENIIKPEEILPDGSKVKNFRYLNPSLNSWRWPNSNITLIFDGLQFELFFTEEYICQLEKKIPSTEALRISIEEATQMIAQTWSLLMRVPGKFSYFQEARDEEFAQDIEEDLVDSFASRVVARVLKKKASIAERRETYLASIGNFCDESSFRKQYPEEDEVFRKFTNLSHSSGLERRKKMLTSHIREALDCL
jgi:hypothetical protein